MNQNMMAARVRKMTTVQQVTTIGKAKIKGALSYDNASCGDAALKFALLDLDPSQGQW